jgi:hypothetical protein
MNTFMMHCQCLGEVQEARPLRGLGEVPALSRRCGRLTLKYKSLLAAAEVPEADAEVPALSRRCGS